MYNNEYSQRTLDALVQSNDISIFPALLKKHNRDDYIKRIATSVADRSFCFSKFERIKIGLFYAQEPIKLGDRLVLRRLNSILRQTYRIKQSDRGDVVRQSLKLLSEPADKYIIKLDIKSFYESINRTKLLRQLDEDQLLSDRTRWLLRTLFDHLKSVVPAGVPRGIGISATLSEIVMRRIDQRIRQLDNIYFFTRYVDDLLIFCTKNPNDIIQKIRALLPDGMALNDEKTNIIHVGCACAHGCIHIARSCPCADKCSCQPDSTQRRELNYLGYRIVFNNVPSSKEKKNGMEVKVGLTASKTNRYKTRIVAALLSHSNAPDFDLLEQRIRFLCENTRLTGPGLRGRLKTGIRFNYPLINNYVDLIDLDRFLRSQIFSARKTYGTRMASSLTRDQKITLSAYSFRSGHSSFRTKLVHSSAFKKIRDCWKHA
ncbi:antiviral reverse transcriptase Drt3a [Paraburkholderia caribensis]|uniref:antiviral reverse transcriptase Drt3a n=1 Tax=Paraburkholderia caribensis TaxID=75105 RepID=UPI00158FB479